jgi:hypothetical protein
MTNGTKMSSKFETIVASRIISAIKLLKLGVAGSSYSPIWTPKWVDKVQLSKTMISAVKKIYIHCLVYRQENVKKKIW